MRRKIIEHGNRIIGDFMGKGFKNPLNYMYDIEWSWLMPAIKKFDNLNLFNTEYESLCDEIDRAVTLYEIKPAWKAFVKALEWYKEYVK